MVLAVIPDWSSFLLGAYDYYVYPSLGSLAAPLRGAVVYFLGNVLGGAGFGGGFSPFF